MSKCKRGHLIDPRRGYCTHFICHNEMMGGPRSHDVGPKAPRRDQKRCPFCLGDSGRFVGQGQCWLAMCDRGPNGTRCGCHYLLSGMTMPSKAEMDMAAIQARQRIHPAFQMARRLL